MSKYLLPILLLLCFILWKVFDALGLPNVLSIIFLLLTIITGIFWCYHWFVLEPKRKRQINRLETRSGKILTDAEKSRVEPVSESVEYLSSMFPIIAIIFIIRSFFYEPFQIPSGSMEPTLRVGDFLLVDKNAYGVKDPIFQHKLIETGEPKRGDVVVFKAPPQPNVDYIKRVIGLPGDHIKYDAFTRTLTITPACGKENCSSQTYTYSVGKANPEFVYHNEAQIEKTENGAVSHQILLNPEPLNFAPYYYKQAGETIGEWTVPQGEYFVMGDNRDNSNDSRFWGFIPEKNLVGKATVVVLSLKRKEGEFPTGIRTDRFFKKIQ